MGIEKLSITQAKKLLRSQVKAKLIALTQDELVYQSHRVIQILSTLPIYQNATKIAFYMNMPNSEVKTLPLIEKAFLDNKRIFLPKISNLSQTHQFKRFDKQKSQLEMLELPNLDSVLTLQPVGPYKLLEPTTGLNALSDSVKGLDLIIVPGVLFTKTCYRMGHGAGFYDDYIKRHVEAGYGKPKLIGIGLLEQLVDLIPLEDHDEVLDGVIIDNNFFD